MGTMIQPTWVASRMVVVVGVDFSHQGEIAFDFACAIAKNIGRADIHAVHAISLAPLPYSDDSLDVAPHLDVATERRRLDELCVRAGPGQRIVRHIVLAGAERAILDVAREQRADLIVLGTHRKSRIERLLTGSVVDRIVRSAPCSVLVSRPQVGAAAPG